MNPDEVLAAVDAGQFDNLIGEAESAVIDFKMSPYRIGEAAQAFELAKDVTAMANSPQGGQLVVGFRTTRSATTAIDTVATVHPFGRDLFDRDQWLDKIDRLAYPTIVGLDARFCQLPDDPERGVVVVIVPAQDPRSRYYVVAKEFASEDGAPGWLVGISVRSFDRNRPLGIAEIHALMSGGLNAGPRLDEIHALVSELHSGGRAVRGPAPADEIDGRVADAVSALLSDPPQDD